MAGGQLPQAGQLPGQQLQTPEGFLRPVNQAQPYTPFESLRVQDMEEFLDRIPRMPLVLQPHEA